LYEGGTRVKRGALSSEKKLLNAEGAEKGSERTSTSLRAGPLRFGKQLPNADLAEKAAKKLLTAKCAKCGAKLAKKASYGVLGDRTADSSLLAPDLKIPTLTSQRARR
jgi:hypothetical protein